MPQKQSRAFSLEFSQRGALGGLFRIGIIIALLKGMRQ